MTVLTIKEASLATMSVELSAIKVNNKQMSLSIFRQIKEEPYFNEETFAENGVPWGTINYFWGEHDKTPKEKIHLIWQKADELRRCVIYPIGLESTKSCFCREIYNDICDANAWLNNNNLYNNKFYKKYEIERPEKYTGKENMHLRDYYAKEIEKASKAKVEILAELEELRKEHAKELRHATDYYNNYMKIYNKLAGQSQLYIGA